MEEKPRKYGPTSYRDQAKPPRGCHIDDKIQNRKNKRTALPTLSAHRYGFNLMWSTVPDTMLWAGVKPFGSYDPNNTHKGKIWGWKREVPLTEETVKVIVYDILERKCLTGPELQAIRKALSFAWQLKVGVKAYYPQKSRNWDAVKVLYATIDWSEDVMPTRHSTLPTVIPTYQQLEDAFCKEWHPGHPMTFIEFEAGVVCGYDTNVIGLRSNEDVKRVKNSKLIEWHIPELFMEIGFLGGRCKLPEKHRPWKLGRVCFCPEGEHVSPTPNDAVFCTPATPHGRLNALGNPHPLPFGWSSTCPLGASQFIDLFEKAKGRVYPKPNKRGNGFTTYNISDVVGYANEWFLAQGVTTVPFSHNAGRKALGVLLEHNSIPYERGFEIHADEYITFRDNYSPKCFRGTTEEFKRRTQHENPTVRLAALRTIANGMGRGIFSPPPPLTRVEEYMHNFLAKSDPEKAEEIRTGRTKKSGLPARPAGLLPSGFVPAPPPERPEFMDIVYR